jgi:membrane dipeptidase
MAELKGTTMTGDARLFTESDAALTRKIGIMDTHNDFAIGILKERFNGNHDSLGEFWIPRFRAGGISVITCPIFIPDIYLPDGALRFTIQVIDALYQEIAENGDEMELARTYDDVTRITASGKIAAILAFEGAEALGQDLSALRLFYQVGLRMLSFAWMRRTLFGDGTWENDSRGGLTRLGKAAVKEVNRLGIIMDVSHASDQTTWDILNTSTSPVIASHSNARALHPHLRNVTDDMIRAIANSGGVVSAVAVSGFITDGSPTIANWVDHIDHIIDVAGIDHVGIGADFYDHLAKINAAPMIADWGLESFDHVPHPFTGMLGPEDLPGLTAELLRRGYGESELRKIYHENYYRVMAEVMR